MSNFWSPFSDTILGPNDKRFQGKPPSPVDTSRKRMEEQAMQLQQSERRIKDLNGKVATLERASVQSRAVCDSFRSENSVLSQENKRLKRDLEEFRKGQQEPVNKEPEVDERAQQLKSLNSIRTSLEYQALELKFMKKQVNNYIHGRISPLEVLDSTVMADLVFVYNDAFRNEQRLHRNAFQILEQIPRTQDQDRKVWLQQMSLVSSTFKTHFDMMEEFGSGLVYLNNKRQVAEQRRAEQRKRSCPPVVRTLAECYEWYRELMAEIESLCEASREHSGERGERGGERSERSDKAVKGKPVRPSDLKMQSVAATAASKEPGTGKGQAAIPSDSRGNTGTGFSKLSSNNFSRLPSALAPGRAGAGPEFTAQSWRDLDRLIAEAKDDVTRESRGRRFQF